MKKYSYIIVDNDAESVLKTRIVAEGFSELTFIASATNYRQGLNLVLEHRPSFVFLEIDPQDSLSHLSLSFIGELYRYLSIIPKIIVTTTKKDLAFEAIQYNVFDYIIKPLTHIDLLKTLLKFERMFLEPKESRSIETKPDINIANEIPVLKAENIPVVIPDQNTNQEFYKPLVICIKSYGDHRYINADDICYFQADNNSTDIYLNSGDMVTAFKTLKHFEQVLTYPFIRIHNSYIINRNYIARIHNGNSVCYIKNSTKKIPFSKTYKANVDLIIADFSKGNYLEI
ncbi:MULTISPECIES: LytR/AlgR family response regulator transcription factor [Flavobacterium]|uniref:LytR/AlgR family response regulator transcription factor n=1 Tax=Flavobacterium TaxID=237 RepID=UPI0021154FCA|nr:MULTISPECIES: LytTR family transcriptional regulator DNA-binding domain-containing protein [Flavobacterium]UUF15337.1 LytTR family transcriptional regulator DNA-binding domain-containing protein [Flavobacterium panici]